MPAKPPLNTASKVTLSESQSRIDRLGLGAEVKELRAKNKSQRAIAQELNEKYNLTGTVNEIKTMTINRYIKKYNLDEIECFDGNYAINVYEQECEMLKSVNIIIATLEMEIADYTEKLNAGERPTGNIKDLVMAVERLYARKQALIGSIKNTQEKIYTFTAVQSIVSKIMDAVKIKNIDLYMEIKNEIINDPMMQECFRKIKDRS